MSSEITKFVVSDEIFELFPDLKLPVAVADGIEGDAEYPEIQGLWQWAWTGASREASSYGNAQSHPRVAAWREAMSAVGVSGRRFPSSIESLLRRALKGAEPFSINPLVDFYNAMSLRHVVPAGGFDLNALEGPLELRLTRHGDTFLPLDGSMPERVAAGEVAYASVEEILTRHFVWKQSRRALLDESTRSAFFVCEVLGTIDDGVAEQVLDEFESGLREHFGVEPRTFLLSEKRPAIAW